MKKMILILLLILMLPVEDISAQIKDCNRKVWIKQLAKSIPNDVCIPNGYHITEVHREVDINNDGLNDFVFDWNKQTLTDGDTIFISVYLRKKDSTFLFFRTFSNLYPIYFKSYKLDYIPDKTELKYLQKRYDDQYPFIKLLFEKDKIKIYRRGDATTDMMISYRFNKESNNWIYDQCELRDSDGHIKQYDLYGIVGPTINNFTYFIWE